MTTDFEIIIATTQMEHTEIVHSLVYSDLLLVKYTQKDYRYHLSNIGSGSTNFHLLSHLIFVLFQLHTITLITPLYI